MDQQFEDKASTGIVGLDDILVGGFARGHTYLLEGNPGTGKTTAALQFLLTGSQAGERCLYITMSETEDELRSGARSHGWTIDDNIEVFQLVPPESVLDPTKQQSLLYSSDLELDEATRSIFATVARIKPQRVVLDSLSEIRLLAQGSLRYRRQILALKHYFALSDTTVLLLDDLTTDAQDKTVHSVAHAVIRLEEVAPEYGAQRRRLRVIKYRGQAFRGGFHDFAIKEGGLAVFPRLVSLEHKTRFKRDSLSSQLPELDALLGGGVDQGTSTLLLGPAGAGKSMLGLHFLIAALAREEKVALFVFDEEIALTQRRFMSLGLDPEQLKRSGQLFMEQIDAAELSPGEFAHRVRALVDIHHVKTVMIDSLNGYQSAMPEEQALLLHMHELLQYLNRQGASTFMTVAQHGLVGDMRAPVDITYLADTVILLRFFEAMGRVRRALSVIKKRSGPHESTIREFRITGHGIEIGAPLTAFRGVLRGVPDYDGIGSDLLETRAE